MLSLRTSYFFFYEDASNVFYTNLVAMMPVWGFMGYTSYSLKSKMEEFKEDVADNTKINFLLDDVLNASRGMSRPSSYVVLDCPATMWSGQRSP